VPLWSCRYSWTNRCCFGVSGGVWAGLGLAMIQKRRFRK
jgi:hypothetical protein